MNFPQLLHVAIQKAGKHETLATELDLAPSALSKRMNGEVGWYEKDLNKLLEYISPDLEKKTRTLKEALKIVLDGCDGDKNL